MRGVRAGGETPVRPATAGAAEAAAGAAAPRTPAEPAPHAGAAGGARARRPRLAGGGAPATANAGAGRGGRRRLRRDGRRERDGGSGMAGGGLLAIASIAGTRTPEPSPSPSPPPSACRAVSGAGARGGPGGAHRSRRSGSKRRACVWRNEGEAARRSRGGVEPREPLPARFAPRSLPVASSSSSSSGPSSSDSEVSGGGPVVTCADWMRPGHFGTGQRPPAPPVRSPKTRQWFRQHDLCVARLEQRTSAQGSSARMAREASLQAGRPHTTSSRIGAVDAPAPPPPPPPRPPACGDAGVDGALCCSLPLPSAGEAAAACAEAAACGR
eukprot:tig00020830_g14500.t1